MRRRATLSSDPAPSPRELLSMLAGRSTWTTPAGGFGGGVKRALTPEAALQVGLAWAAREEPVGAMIAIAIATGSTRGVEAIVDRVVPQALRDLGADRRYARLVSDERGEARLRAVAAAVVTNLIHGRRALRGRRGMRQQDWTRLYRVMHDALNLAAQTAEAAAVNYLR